MNTSYFGLHYMDKASLTIQSINQKSGKILAERAGDTDNEVEKCWGEMYLCHVV